MFVPTPSGSRARLRALARVRCGARLPRTTTDASTANLRADILDFRGFDSSIILILRGGILMSMGDFPESLSQAILVGIMLVGRLGVMADSSMHQPPRALPLGRAPKRLCLFAPKKGCHPGKTNVLRSLCSYCFLVVCKSCPRKLGARSQSAGIPALLSRSNTAGGTYSA